MLIFISYRSVDRALVESLAADLHGLGHTVWFDQELTGGHAWWNSILNNVQQCDLFIFALSPQSLDSYPCQLEYNYADALGKRILPVLLKEINAHLLPPELSKIQFVDYRLQDKKASIGLARALAALPAAMPLPDPLPDPPEAPISGLGRIKERLESTVRLGPDEQAALVLEIKGFYQKDDTRITAQELFERLQNRADLFANIGREIESILGTGQPANQPQSLVTKTISAPTRFSAVNRPTTLSDTTIRSWLSRYLWAVLGSFISIVPLTTLSPPENTLLTQIVIALPVAFGLMLASTLPKWLRNRLPKPNSRLNVVLAYLIATLFVEVIMYYPITYFEGTILSSSIWLPAALTSLGFVVGATWLPDRLGARILTGAAGVAGSYALIHAFIPYYLRSFPLEYARTDIRNAAVFFVENYTLSVCIWYVAVALACSLFVHWPQIAQRHNADK